ncbi:hypothetical protein [Muriicola sp. Z0-33]|uniref:DUF3108 domain-containing protein n=1 Tax=Muriicola sp. Z0-33 TaxID=2816957 RepID=UPI002238B0FB|nr:hypothetical protein [Muriicola sp. Z0-33]MCW5516942.1 hypothetical protein [Muriicola sp. Z0-33]
MKKLLYILMITLMTYMQVSSQETPLNPLNNSADNSLIKSENSKMTWFMIKDSIKMPIGNIETIINKDKAKIYIVTIVNMEQSSIKWIDSTVVQTKNFKPIYHSSNNQQRDMVLKFGEKISGYYLDKQTGVKTQISEEVHKPFFDSNFYPQLIRLLPLKNGYSNTISIFDYNPKTKTGVITATVKNTEETTINFNGKKTEVFKVHASDDISNNSTQSTYYIDVSTRKILKQEIDFGGRKMLMELVN